MKFARTAMTAAAALCLSLGVASSAYAQDDDVYWAMRGSNDCLGHDALERVVAIQAPCHYDHSLSRPGQAGWYVTWHEDNSNLDSPDGAWAMKTIGDDGKCLTAFKQGQVYLEPCSGPVNWYEQWYEDWKDGNFHLRNRATGQCITRPDTRTQDITTAGCDWNNLDEAMF
uniref:hypothetical protein n=1 Tax=Streptomyces sp. NPDC052396 TaxID=3365689 RepID=UPI0037D5CB47